MRRLIVKSFLLALPFLFVGLITATVDPYHYFVTSLHPENRDWDDIASRMSPTLWKLVAFRKDPSPNILLGDSRMASLDVTRIAVVARASFANLAYGGGSLDEAIKTFWYADSRIDLRSATFGVNLDLYNALNAKDRVTATEQIIDSWVRYLSDRLVIRTVFYDLAVATIGYHPALGTPSMSKDAFWRFQLDVTARIAYSNYRYPESYRTRLEEIAAHCRAKGIRLRFLVLPEHHDLVTEAARYGLADASRRMLDDLSGIAETIDLRAPGKDDDRALFLDPYHFTPEVGVTIIERIWGMPPRLNETLVSH
jgi:hypothetical protein